MSHEQGPQVPGLNQKRTCTSNFLLPAKHKDQQPVVYLDTSSVLICTANPNFAVLSAPPDLAMSELGNEQLIGIVGHVFRDRIGTLLGHHWIQTSVITSHLGLQSWLSLMLMSIQMIGSEQVELTLLFLLLVHFPNT